MDISLPKFPLASLTIYHLRPETLGVAVPGHIERRQK